MGDSWAENIRVIEHNYGYNKCRPILDIFSVMCIININSLSTQNRSWRVCRLDVLLHCCFKVTILLWFCLALLVLQVLQSLLLLVNGISALPRGTIVLQVNSEIGNNSFNWMCFITSPSRPFWILAPT